MPQSVSKRRSWIGSLRVPLLLNSIVGIWLQGLFPRRKALAELRAHWGLPGAKDEREAARYFELVRGADPAMYVDDGTWNDLELPQVFADLDATVTPVGSQVLFQQLRTWGATCDLLAARYAAYAELRSNVALREAVQQRLLPLADERNARIADFILGPLPQALSHPAWWRAWVLVSLLALVAAIVWPGLIWIWFMVLVANAIVRVRIGIAGRTLRDLQTLQGCLRLVRVAADLGRIQVATTALPQLARLRAEEPNRARVSRALGGLVMWTSWAGVFPISVVVGLANMALLADLLLYARALRRFARLRHRLAASLRLVGEVDAAVGVASWLGPRPEHCLPELTERALLDVRGGRHPLLDRGVANSIRLEGTSALVTGSNMAGKTTFVTMLATNALLGQTLGFCLASAAIIPRGRVRASIRAAPSVASGRSRYFAEVEAIRGFLDQPAPGGTTVLAIDEPFGGTNTVERIAIARAVLEALGRRALVLVTTHDVELQSLLDGRYELYHFQEDPAVDGFFDYRLRSGPATARNAIRLLREMHFPEGVVARALDYAAPEALAGPQGSAASPEAESSAAADADSA